MIKYLETINFDIEEINDLVNTYDNFIIKNIDLDNMKQIVALFKKKNINKDIIKDSILNNLEIYTYPNWFIRKRVNELEKLNKNITDIIINKPEILYSKEEIK